MSQSVKSDETIKEEPPIIKVRQDLRFTVHIGEREPLYVIEDPLKKKYYRIGQTEYLFICQLNGKNTITNAVERVNELEGGIALSEKQIGNILKWLMINQLLIQNDLPLLEKLYLFEKRQKKLQSTSRFNLIFIKVPLFNPDKILDHLKPLLMWITGIPFFLLWCAIAVFSIYTLYSSWDQFAMKTMDILSVGNLIWLWSAWILLKILHELSHALVCRKYGGKVYEAGILFVLFIPLTYVDATSSWNFPNRWQRIHVAFAGIFMELFIAGLAILFWAESPNSVLGTIAYNVVIVASVSTLLFNSNPLMRFDGYYILSDLIGIPNLYAHGRRYVTDQFRSFFLGINITGSQYSGFRETFIKVYGVAAYFWKLLVVVTLMLGASKLFHGAGRAIALVAIFVWVGLPLFSLIKNVSKIRKDHPGMIKRLFLRTLILISLSILVFTQLEWRWEKSAPAVVEYENQFVVRAKSPGFVEHMYIKVGNYVKRGQKLFQLINPEINLRLRDLQLEIEQQEIEARLYFNNNNLSAFQVYKDKIKVLEKKALMLSAEIDALSIVSPVDGTILGDDLETLYGTFLLKGREILWVVSENRKKITVSIDQRDVGAFRQNANRTVEVDMRNSGHGTFQGRVKHIDPLASPDIPHPALSAENGGPLDIRLGEADKKGSKTMISSYRSQFFLPRFKAEVELPQDKVEALKVGQLAFVHIPGKKESLGLKIKEYFKNKFGKVL